MSESMTREPMLNTDQAAEYMGVRVVVLRRLVRQKKVPVIRHGRLGFYPSDLDQAIAQMRTPATGLQPVPLTMRAARVALSDDTSIDALLREIRKNGDAPFDPARFDRDAAPPSRHRQAGRSITRGTKRRRGHA